MRATVRPRASLVRVRSQPWIIRGLWLSVLVHTGCHGTHEQAKQDAAQRWNRVRASMKVRLAEEHLNAGNLEDAYAEVAQAQALDPTLPGLCAVAAKTHLAHGKTQAAERTLDEAAESGGDDAEAHYLRGIICEQRSRWTDALDHYLHAAERNPEQISYFVAVSQTLLQLNRATVALRVLSARKEDFGWNPTYRATLAQCFEALDRWPEAASAWSQVPDAATDFDRRRRLGNALYRAERFAEAAAVLAELVDRGSGPSTDSMRIALSHCLLECGRHRDAHMEIMRVLENDARSIRALRLLARIHAEQGELDRAHEIARRAVTIDPHDLQTLELAAALAYRAGDEEMASALTVRLLDEAPDSPVAHGMADRMGRTSSNDRSAQTNAGGDTGDGCEPLTSECEGRLDGDLTNPPDTQGAVGAVTSDLD